MIKHRNIYIENYLSFNMKKILILLVLLMILPNVLAINLTIEKQSENEVMIVDANEPLILDLKVTNNGETDKFLFYTFFGFGFEPSERIEIKQGETKNVQFKIYPSPGYEPRGFSTFNYFVQTPNKSEIKQRLTINVIDVKDAFEIGAGEINPESNAIEIYLYNKVNFEFKDLKINFNSAFFQLNQEFDLLPNEKKIFEINLNKEEFNELLAGFYTMNAEITYKEIITNLESPIKFAEKDILTTTKQEYGFIIHTKIIEKSNQGNVVLDSQTTVKKNILSRLFTSYSPQPSLVERQGFSVYYTWNNEIKPGETLKVMIKTNWILPFLILILLIIIIVLAKIYSRRSLVLRKSVRFVRAKGGEFALKVSIIVDSKKYLEKVNIIDRLPPLVKIYEKFFGEQPSKIDQNKKRIEWNFEKLEQGERRVLSYIIYSKVGVLGKFALPRTTAIFEREGKIKEVNSNKTYFVAEQIGRQKEEY